MVPLFTEDQFIAALKQALTSVHARSDTIIFHSLFKFDQCYEAMAIQQQYAQQAIIKSPSPSPTNSYDNYWHHYYHTNSHCCVRSAHVIAINGPGNQYWMALFWFYEWHLPQDVTPFWWRSPYCTVKLLTCRAATSDYFNYWSCFVFSIIYL